MVKKKTKKRRKTKTELKEARIKKRGQIKTQNKILKNTLIGIIFVIAVIFVIVFVMYSMTHFKYEGVKFKIVKEGNLVLYQTSLPVNYQGEKMPYNFYLRNDPRETGEIPFDGYINFAENMVINSTSDFNCDGDGVIAVANLLNLYKISGIDVIKDNSADCDPEGRYSFIRLQEANETSIDKFGPSCYDVNIHNCEILKATERLMIESFIEINKLI